MDYGFIEGEAMKCWRRLNLIWVLALGTVILFLSSNTKTARASGETVSLSFSNDTYVQAQWAIDNPGYFYLTMPGFGQMAKSSVVDVDMDVWEAWNELDKIETREVVVAIIDTGIDINHPDLADNIWINKGEIPGDGIDNDGNGYIDDVNGWDFYNGDGTVSHYKYDEKLGINVADPKDNDDHGTHIAGIIGAIPNNNIGVAGIASTINIKIMPLKINGGEKGTGKISSAIDAIKYATMMGADICNISWGTSEDIPALKQAIKESDMLFVVAAGNSGEDNDVVPIYPANYELDNLISVTFIDSNGGLTKLSNYGLSMVDLAAPGEDIISTVVGSYGLMSGSSMAAPHLTAVAAMVYATNDNPYPADVKEILLKNIKTLPSISKQIRNPGIPSAYKALVNSKDKLVVDNESPKISLKTNYNKGLMTVPVEVTDNGGSDIRVVKWMYGKRTVEEFRRGTEGTLVENGVVSVAKAGTYSFYSSDYAGNETVKVYDVKEDKEAPILNLTYTVADSYKNRTVRVRVIDEQSGIRRVKYMEGVRKPEEFLPAGAGTELDIKDGKGSFKVKKDGVYTVYAIDNRGNQSVKKIDVKTVISTDLKLVQTSKTINVGETYVIRAFLKPSGYTDKVTFISKDNKVATVSNQGKIKGISEGSVNIIVRTSSGLEKICRVKVVKPDIASGS